MFGVDIWWTKNYLESKYFILIVFRVEFYDD